MLVTLRGQRVNPFTPTSDQDRISPYNVNSHIKQAGDENKEYQSWEN